MTRRLSALLLFLLLAGLLAPASQVRAETTSYYGLSFDGTNYVQATWSSSLNSINTTKSFTVIEIFKPLKWSGSVGRAHWLFATSNILSIKTGSAPDLVIGYMGVSGTYEYLVTSLSMKHLGEYMFVAYSYSNSTGELRGYVDGQLVSTKTTSDPPNTSGATYLRIAYADASGYSATGNVALVLIYNRALSDSEIQQIYNDPLHPPTSGLVLFYAPDSVDTANNVWKDLSGNGNDGSIVGATYVPLRPVSESEPSAGSPYELDFNGQSSYVYLNNETFAPRPTLIVFFKANNLSNNPKLFRSNPWRIILGIINNKPWLELWNSTGGRISSFGVNYQLKLQTNYMVAFAYGYDNIIRAYINGKFVQSYDPASHGYSTADVGSFISAYIGAYSPTTSMFFNGSIYMLLLYSRPLSDAEIAQIYEDPTNPPLDGLVLWYSPYTYDPASGKWLNRAPIFPTIPLVEELDGVNYGAEAVRVSIPNLTAVNIENNSIIPTVDLITNITYNGTTVSIIPTFPTLPYGTIVQMNVSAPGYYPISFPVYTTTSTITAYLRPIPPEETPLGNATLPGIVVPTNLSMIKNQLQLKFTQNLKDFFSTRLGVAMALMLVLAIAVMSLLSHRNTFVTISAVGIAVIYLSYYANAPWGVMWTPMLMWVGFGLWKMVGKGEDV